MQIVDRDYWANLLQQWD